MKVLAKVNKRAWPYLFILPWIIGFLVFTLGPLVLSFVMSFFDWSITGTPKFRGLGNYIEMFTTDDQVLKSLSISLKYAAIFVPLNMIIALVLAMLISQPVKGAKFFRTIFYIPAVISGVAVSIIFGWLLNGNYGVINYLLSLLGIDGPQWLVDPKWAIIAVIFASAFGVGSMMLIFYTDIKNIPIDLYEAAAIDGAGPARQFFSITLPMITRPSCSISSRQSSVVPAGHPGHAADERWSDEVHIFLRTDDLQQRLQIPQARLRLRQRMGHVHHHPAA